MSELLNYRSFKETDEESSAGLQYSGELSEGNPDRSGLMVNERVPREDPAGRARSDIESIQAADVERDVRKGRAGMLDERGYQIHTAGSESMPGQEGSPLARTTSRVYHGTLDAVRPGSYKLTIGRMHSLYRPKKLRILRGAACVRTANLSSHEVESRDP